MLVALKATRFRDKYSHESMNYRSLSLILNFPCLKQVSLVAGEWPFQAHKPVPSQMKCLKPYSIMLNSEDLATSPLRQDLL